MAGDCVITQGSGGDFCCCTSWYDRDGAAFVQSGSSSILLDLVVQLEDTLSVLAHGLAETLTCFTLYQLDMINNSQQTQLTHPACLV